MIYLSKTIGMWFMGLEYSEIGESGSLLESSMCKGIDTKKAFNRILKEFLCNIALGIPYIELVYSLDGLQWLDRKTKIFVIARVQSN